MNQNGRIRTPWPLRLRRLRYGLLPLLCFAACAVATFALWQRQMPRANAVGEAEVVRLDVGAPTDGTLVAFRSPWTLFETVAAHQVLARLDDRVARAELEATQQEVDRLRKEVEAARAKELADAADRQANRLGEVLRATWEAEGRRLDVLDRTVTLEVARVELQRRGARLEYLQPLLESGAVSQIQYTDEELLHDKLGRQVDEAVRALEESTKQREAAIVRLQEFPPIDDMALEAVLSPLQAAISVQETRVKQIEYQVQNLDVRAPISGTIVAVHCWPGQSVRAGDPLITLAADRSRYVVSYLREEHRVTPEVGMAVELRVRRPGGLAVFSLVDHVGPQVELIPEHQRRDPRLPEWGRPVRISLPDELGATPGELLDVRFQPTSVAKSGAG